MLSSFSVGIKEIPKDIIVDRALFKSFSVQISEIKEEYVEDRGLFRSFSVILGEEFPTRIYIQDYKVILNK